MTNTIGELAVNGRFVGSKEYFIYLNKRFLKGELTKGSNYYKYGELYSDVVGKVKNGRYKGPLNVGKKTYKDDFYNIFKPLAKQIKDDLDKGKYWLNYIKDENAERLKKALGDLKACGVVEGFMATAQHKLEALNWYIDLDKSKVLSMQKILNELGYGPVSESGVYDIKTDKAWSAFLNDLENGSFAELKTVKSAESWLNYSGGAFDMVLKSIERMVKVPIVIERGVPFNGNFIDEVISGGIPSKVIKIGHNTIIIFGMALDLLELGVELELDMHDADKKIGKKTFAQFVEIVIDWEGLWVAMEAGKTVFGFCVAYGGPVGVIVGAVADYVLCVSITELASYLGDLASEFIFDLDLESF